jgi:hypothetical protein
MSPEAWHSRRGIPAVLQHLGQGICPSRQEDGHGEPGRRRPDRHGPGAFFVKNATAHAGKITIAISKAPTSPISVGYLVIRT